jgi:hypothetical protein
LLHYLDYYYCLFYIICSYYRVRYENNILVPLHDDVGGAWSARSRVRRSRGYGDVSRALLYLSRISQWKTKLPCLDYTNYCCSPNLFWFMFCSQFWFEFLGRRIHHRSLFSCYRNNLWYTWPSIVSSSCARCWFRSQPFYFHLP